MTRSTKALAWSSVTAVLAVGLFVYLYWQFLGSSAPRRSPSGQRDGSSSSPAPPPSSAAGAALQPNDGAIAQSGAVGGLASVAASTKVSGTLADNRDPRSVMPSSTVATATVHVPSDDSTSAADGIGKTFAVSPSVTALCDRAGDYCDEVFRQLSIMADESRETSWAAYAESQIRAWVMGSDPGQFSIRALECRSNTCALEISSALGALRWGSRASLLKGLSVWDVVIGHEEDASSTPITVTLIVFRRSD